jgi:hypothetical protein
MGVLGAKGGGGGNGVALVRVATCRRRAGRIILKSGSGRCGGLAVVYERGIGFGSVASPIYDIQY